MEKNIRKIIHVDMDAFYASVEQMDDPTLKDKPVAVGGSKERGVVAAASYEARKFGVRSAMASVQAKKRCPGLIFVKPRFERYKEIAFQTRDIFLDYTDIIEPLSLDEAFLDVTKNKKGIEIASDIATEIRQRINSEIGLTASAGISINKFLSKVATEINKPNGQKTIHPSQVDKFIDNLPITKFFGVGKVTAKKMHGIGIHNGADLRKLDKLTLNNHFGKTGSHYYNIVRSIQSSKVDPNRIRKSIGAEQTFSQDIDTESFMLDKLAGIAIELERRMIKSANKGKTITIKIKYSDFSQQTRSKTIEHYVSSKEEFFPIIKELLFQKKIKKSVRLLGISITNLYKHSTLSKNHYSLQLKFDFE
tara:strand:- start:1851 stop:2939 length:1089 start_codon:yes stop_codon:yes gene_type:complete